MAKLRLVQTCGACPEQYDVFQGDINVGYLRLRHGHFRAECGGQVVYEANPEGDGIFTSDERPFYLRMACQAILARLGDEQEDLYEVVPVNYEEI